MANLRRLFVKRRLFTVCAAISLLLCVATAALWAKSHAQMTTAACTTFSSDQQTLTIRRIRSNNGSVSFSVTKASAARADADSGTGWTMHSGPPHANLGSKYAGFGWSTRPEATFVLLPYWAIVSMLAMLPLIAAARHCREVIRLNRLSRHLCATCGYDLRATPDGCPECGTVPQPEAAGNTS